jgi:hypothetical protein
VNLFATRRQRNQLHQAMGKSPVLYIVRRLFTAAKSCRGLRDVSAAISAIGATCSARVFKLLTSHSTQGQAAHRPLVNVDMEQAAGEKLVNGS